MKTRGDATKKQWLTTERTLALACLALATFAGACSSQQDAIRAVPDDQKKVLLVQAFQNASAGAAAEYDPWRLGLSSMIQDDLVSVGYFRVASAEGRKKALEEMAFSRTGLTPEIIQVGEMLGADWILGGDFIVNGGQLQISTKVIETRTGKTLATARKAGTTKQFFDVSKDVSVRLIEQFNFDLTSGEVVILRKHVETKNAAASLKNYAGEELLLRIKRLELQLKDDPNADEEEIKIEIEALRKKAALRFKRALKDDANYQKAQENLNRLTLMLPSSI